MKTHILTIAGVSVLVFGMISRAEIKTVADHSENPTASFKFKNVPAPSKNDAATQAVFTIVDGAMDNNGGNVEKLHDGRVPTDDDQPSENFFFQTGTDGGRVRVDLGRAIDIKQVNTWFLYEPETKGAEITQRGLHPVSSAAKRGGVVAARQPLPLNTYEALGCFQQSLRDRGKSSASGS